MFWRASALKGNPRLGKAEVVQAHFFPRRAMRRASAEWDCQLLDDLMSETSGSTLRRPTAAFESQISSLPPTPRVLDALAPSRLMRHRVKTGVSTLSAELTFKLHSLAAVTSATILDLTGHAHAANRTYQALTHGDCQRREARAR